MTNFIIWTHYTRAPTWVCWHE